MDRGRRDEAGYLDVSERWLQVGLVSPDQYDNYDDDEGGEGDRHAHMHVSGRTSKELDEDLAMAVSSI